MLIDECGCFDPSLKNNLLSETPCLTEEHMECLNLKWEEFNKLNIVEKCSQCPLECETLTFPLTISSSFYPNEAYAKFLLDNSLIKNNSFTMWDLREKVLAFNIYYESLKHTKFTQMPKFEFIDLVALIGGYLSLFLEISILTIIEVIELIFKFYITNKTIRI